MRDLSVDNRKWKELGIGDKIKFSIAASLVVASVVLGFVSFIILLEVPTSVIGLDGLWLSTALAVLGISAHFKNEMVKFQSNVNDRLNRINKNDYEDELPNTTND